MNRGKRKALIIGAGIAGPAAALFLKRAGIEAEIYEARATPSGVALSLSSNGVAVLKLLALDGAVMAQGSPVATGMLWNGKGKPLGVAPLAGEGQKSVFIKRVPPDFPSYALPTPPVSWHKEPVVLLGDAAHAISPSSGQGASMALEDAAVLAKRLRDIPDLEQAFATYERLRRARPAKMFDLGQRGDSGKFVTGAVRQ